MSKTARMYRFLKNAAVQPYAKGTLVYSRDAKHRGRLTGSRRLCSLEGCGGFKLGVRWDNGKTTFPCTNGMSFRKISWRIM
ncbi:MAG: hypothetical protein IMZ61_11505 [Planctomycetes bacterium]|nr:hypothetical protein [Planctomycetota bacterium]